MYSVNSHKFLVYILYGIWWGMASWALELSLIGGDWNVLAHILRCLTRWCTWTTRNSPLPAGQTGPRSYRCCSRPRTTVTIPSGLTIFLRVPSGCPTRFASSLLLFVRNPWARDVALSKKQKMKFVKLLVVECGVVINVSLGVGEWGVTQTIICNYKL